VVCYNYERSCFKCCGVLLVVITKDQYVCCHTGNEYDKRVGKNVHMVMAVCFASLSVKFFIFILYNKLFKKNSLY